MKWKLVVTLKSISMSLIHLKVCFKDLFFHKHCQICLRCAKWPLLIDSEVCVIKIMNALMYRINPQLRRKYIIKTLADWFNIKKPLHSVVLSTGKWRKGFIFYRMQAPLHIHLTSLSVFFFPQESVVKECTATLLQICSRACAHIRTVLHGW